MKKLLRISLCFLLLVTLTASASFMTNVYAAETEELYIETEFSQTDARNMLSDINAFRTDSTGGAWYWNADDTTKTVFNTGSNKVLNELKYDYELEKVAMQRAAEISVSFSHTRPDGSTCFTAYPSGYNYKGENIAAGYPTALAAFEGWQENDDPYSGQGHRRNMLSSNFNAIGIGHAYVNGIHYWVQELGYTSNTTTKTTAVEATVTTSVLADSSKLTLKSSELIGSSSYEIRKGEKAALPGVAFSYDFEDHWPSYVDIVSKPTVKWSSSNSSVAEAENGMVVGKGSGQAILKPEGTSLEVTVNVITELEIIQQPKDVSAKSGETAKVTLTATGDGLTYTWYEKDAGASGFTKSKTTSSAYSVEMQKSLSGRQVYCVVADKYGNSVKSNTVTIRLAAAITKQPTAVSGTIGSRVSVSVAAEGDELTYTWYFKNPGSSSFTKSGVTVSTYTMTMQKSLSGRQVYCVVKDKYGNSVQSNTVTLSAAADPVKITTQPKTTYAKLNTSAKVTVAAEGDGLTYTWYFKNPGSSSYSKSGITSSNYSATMQKSLSGRKVYCIVADKYGNSVRSNTIDLYLAATITTQPTSKSAAVGSKATVSVSAAGDGLTYAWYFKNPGEADYTKSGITASSYSMTMQKSLSGRKVYCVVTDKYGKTDKSSTVTLSAQTASVKITTQPKTTYAKLNASAKVTIAASGDGLTYTWYFKNPGASGYTKSSIASSTYSMTMQKSLSGRQVYCVVTDKNGNTAKSDTVYIYLSATITKQPASTSAAVGSKATVSVTAAGDGLSYTWYFKNPGESDFTKSGITSSTYSMTMQKSLSGRKVYCVVTDKYGKKATSNTVTVTAE